MKFYSSASRLRIVVKKGGLRPDAAVPGQFEPVLSEYAQFQGGQYDTAVDYHGTLTEEEVTQILLAHPSYGYRGTTQDPRYRGKFEANLFWSELDRPEAERVEEKMKRLEAEVEALRKATDAKIIYIEKPAKDEEETGLQRRNRLMKEAKERGMTISRDMSADDLQAALAAKEA